jgi:hypothetical protein
MSWCSQKMKERSCIDRYWDRKANYQYQINDEVHTRICFILNACFSHFLWTKPNKRTTARNNNLTI